MSAQFDFERASAAMPAWDYSIRYDGVRYVTRRPTIETLVRLQAIVNNPQFAKLPELVEALKGCFITAPPLKRWHLEELFVMVRAMLARAGHHLKASAPAMLAEATRAAGLPAAIPAIHGDEATKERPPTP